MMRERTLHVFLLLLAVARESFTATSPPPPPARRVLVYGLPKSGATLFAYVLGQTPGAVVIPLLPGNEPPSPSDLANVPSDSTVIVRAVVDVDATLPALVRRFRPHATALFVRCPVANYASLSETKGNHSGGSSVDAQFRLLERLWAVRQRVFNATVHLEEVVGLRPILGVKLEQLGEFL